MPVGQVLRVKLPAAVAGTGGSQRTGLERGRPALQVGQGNGGTTVRRGAAAGALHPALLCLQDSVNKSENITA